MGWHINLLRQQRPIHGGVGDQAREVNAQCFMAMVCNSDPGAESSRCVFVGHGSSLACPFYCKTGSFVSNRTSCVACTVLPQLLDWNHDVLGRLHVSPSLYCSSLLLWECRSMVMFPGRAGCGLCVVRVNKQTWTWRVTGLSNMVGQTIDLNALYPVRWADKSVEFIWSVLKAQEVNAHCQGFIAMVHNSNQGTGWLEIRLLEGKSMLKIVWPWFITRIQVQWYSVVWDKALGSGCIKFNTLV